MKHGVLLTAHNNVFVVNTLLKMLDDVRFTFYVLIDKKSEYSPYDFIPNLKYANVCILPRIDINWAGFSQIKAELLLIQAALKDGQEMLHFLQGADLPLKTPEQIDNFFSQGGIFLDINSKPDQFAHYKVLCKHFFTDFKSFRYNKILKILNHSIAHIQKPFMKFSNMYQHLYAGSATWSIPNYFGEYILNHKLEIYRMYRYTLAADEVFIHTLLMNSDYQKTLNTNKIRLIDWINREGNSPKTFTIQDKQEISNAILDPSMMFARKFNENINREIVEFVFNMVSGSEV